MLARQGRRCAPRQQRDDAAAAATTADAATSVLDATWLYLEINWNLYSVAYKAVRLFLQAQNAGWVDRAACDPLVLSECHLLHKLGRFKRRVI